MRYLTRIRVWLPTLGLLICGCSAQQQTTAPSPCGTNAARATDADRLAALPTAVMSLEDARGDLLLDHPVFEQNFEVRFESNASIPPAFDLVGVRLNRDGQQYCFRLQTAGSDVAERLRSNGRTARFAVYIDRDANGASDLLVTTTDQFERAVVVTPDLSRVEESARSSATNDSVTLCVSHAAVGDHFTWLAVSGYSPAARAYHPTRLEHVFFTPEVDIAHSAGGMVEILTTLSGSGQSCQVTSTGYNTCPAAGNPTGVPVAGTSHDGVLILEKQCGGVGYALWCLDGSFFGKRVFSASADGWVAKCPFTCGYNQESDWDQNGDNVPDKLTHTVTDANCGSSFNDDDSDGRRDVMRHEYLYAPNQVTSCNIERDLTTNVQVDKRCLAAKAPYADPSTVPGHIP